MFATEWMKIQAPECPLQSKVTPGAEPGGMLSSQQAMLFFTSSHKCFPTSGCSSHACCLPHKHILLPYFLFHFSFSGLSLMLLPGGFSAPLKQVPSLWCLQTSMVPKGVRNTSWLESWELEAKLSSAGRRGLKPGMRQAEDGVKRGNPGFSLAHLSDGAS